MPSLPTLPTQIAEHNIDRTRVSRNAVAVIDKLRGAGFDAYLVGGCVRDLLLGKVPKDFDVATDATPEDARRVFPRVRLVGRRFRIVHVRMGREVIEVSTFRRAMNDDDEGPGSHLSEEGIILRDNVYGTIDEDAFRRDFTVNALYYDPVGDLVLDYCNGMADIRSRTLRLIGKPEQRFREDPVRILRAIRFAAKLDLKPDPATENAIAPMCEMLTAIPPARLFDEFTKLFMTGHAERAFELLCKHELVEILFPLPPHGEALARLALANTDRRLQEGKPVTPGFLLAAFLWQEFLERSGPAMPSDAGPVRHRDSQLQDDAARAVITAQQATISIPRRHAWFVQDVWRLQPLLVTTTPRNATKLLVHPRFRAAYDFLLLRVEAGDASEELARWWTEAQDTDAGELPSRTRDDRPRRRRRRRRTPRAGTEPEVTNSRQDAIP